ncbi:Inner membrane protein YgaP [Tritonibacter multivorans]|uniref:Inner membrane protein YgaP n=1 Tax=Tritonibacter multivorans TaxID=928856 RepID=A0A0P1G3V6_9RHOB|nr:rhodanese-like domain-containing protein [Tritonibacter multivorans]MDA7421948.1 rhodanese-like domain-containing protein [Tritonibacter multivorans]CUH76526.1 Inner membrane protein YgaP [Tritonibacter multivorans]SFD46677.1 Rhodanese-related sulfurtransferase [Tritonibacter multivorans]
MSFFQRFCGVVALAVVPLAVQAQESPVSVAGASTVSVEEAYALFEQEAIFVDVRKPSDFDSGHIPEAVHLDLKSTFNEGALAEVAQKTDAVVFYCNGWSCLRSSKASEQAVAWGYSNVYYFRDGMPGWDVAGLPVE